MSQHAANAYPLGKYAENGELPNLLGQEGSFKHDDGGGNGDPVTGESSGRMTKARWVKNQSGGNLTAGTLCTGDNTANYGPLKGVGGVATGGNQSKATGFVDPLVVGNIPNGANFWLVYDGPAKAKFTTGTALAPNDSLKTGAAGRVAQAAGTIAAADAFDFVGISNATVASGAANDTLFDIIASVAS